jgi:hypothetical protein
MRRTIGFGFLLVGALALAVLAADAAVLELDPSAVTASPGDTVTVDLVASGLGGAAVGDFDVDISFEPGHLTFTGLTLTAKLGDIALGDALDFSLGDLGGIVNVALVSTLSPAALALLQSDPLILATLTFDVTGLAAGKSTTIAVDVVNALGDANGQDVSVATLGASTVRAPGGTAVPGPAPLWLVGAGLLWLTGSGARRARSRAYAESRSGTPIPTTRARSRARSA